MVFLVRNGDRDVGKTKTVLSMRLEKKDILVNLMVRIWLKIRRLVVYLINQQKKNLKRKLLKKLKKINEQLEETFNFDRRHEDEVMDAYILDDEEYAPLFTKLRESNNEKLAKDYDRVEEIFKDYNGTQARSIAGIVNSLYDNKETMGDIGFESWFHAYEDGDQSYLTGPSLYARMEKNIKSEELDRLYDNLHVNNNLVKENIQYLKNNNRTLSKVNDEYLEKLVKRNDDQWNEKKNSRAYWQLYNAAYENMEYDDAIKKNYKDAKNIAKKLDKSCSTNDGWYYLNQAIEKSWNE